jgi:hypothetical protein
MSMTVLEATVEVVKAGITGNGSQSSVNTTALITNEKHHEGIVKFIETIYKKFEELEGGKGVSEGGSKVTM